MENLKAVVSLGHEALGVNTNEQMTEWLDKCPYEKHPSNENTTVSDTEVLAAAEKVMERFDEAFKELAK